MKVIALQGPSNSGKSHTINIIYQFLLFEKWTQVPSHFRILGNSKNEDISDILMKNNILLGIIGMGDFPPGEKESLDILINELEKKGCEIIICASTDNSKITDSLNTLYNPIWVIKSKPKTNADFRIINFIDAQNVINHIKNLQ